MKTPDYVLNSSLYESTANGIDADHGPRRLLTESERNQILYEWNDTRAEFPALCAHQLFEQQVEQDPDAIAVVFN
jgi:non-ribosomal peptide synthetase component F